LNRLAHFAGTPNSNRERRDILGDDGSRSNRAALADCHAGKDYDIPSNPAVIADEDGVAKLDEFPARQDTRVMACCVDRDVRAELYAVADDDQACVEGREAIYLLAIV
jgi:hypothetical protein